MVCDALSGFSCSGQIQVSQMITPILLLSITCMKTNWLTEDNSEVSILHMQNHQTARGHGCSLKHALHGCPPCHDATHSETQINRVTFNYCIYPIYPWFLRFVCYHFRCVLLAKLSSTYHFDDGDKRKPTAKTKRTWQMEQKQKPNRSKFHYKNPNWNRGWDFSGSRVDMFPRAGCKPKGVGVTFFCVRAWS